MPPVFSTIRPTTINGKDHNMTYEQSLDLAELQADMAFETYLSAFDVNERLKVTRFQRLILTRLLGAKAPRRTALI